MHTKYQNLEMMSLACVILPGINRVKQNFFPMLHDPSLIVPLPGYTKNDTLPKLGQQHIGF